MLKADTTTKCHHDLPYMELTWRLVDADTLAAKTDYIPYSMNLIISASIFRAGVCIRNFLEKK